MDHISNTHFIKFDSTSKKVAWNPPAGVYNTVFRSSGKDSTDRDILRFEITSLENPLYQYWVRHGYRGSDRWKLEDHLWNWLGEEEYKGILENGGLSFEKYYGRGADVEVGLIYKSDEKEPIRVINRVAPLGTLLPIVQEIGEFQI